MRKQKIDREARGRFFAKASPERILRVRGFFLIFLYNQGTPAVVLQTACDLKIARF